jgi:alpha-N-arabinofuranosidase
MGRAVYQGVYEPESPHADESGCRTDVLSALKRLSMTAMRYPGGNFVSGYHFLDGVGPKDQRPTMRELAWQSIEPNQFGTDEFIALSREMNWTPMLAVNLGTGTPEEARNWVEYCNCPPGTKYADMRAAHGNIDPFAVPLWCLGNEMDAAWQLGHVPAEQYAIRAQQAAKMMKDADPNIELVACGSCSPMMQTYVDWDRKVLEYIANEVDYISLHRYVDNHANDTADFLAVTNSIDQQIEEIDAVCKYAKAKNRSFKRAYLCFDEWNVWYKNLEIDGKGKFAPHLVEEVYNLEDALVAAGFLNSFIRHADVVKIANIAQIVNVIAPILTRGDEMLIQSIFYAFEMFSKRRDGDSLQLSLDGPTYMSKSFGAVNTIDASAIHSDNTLHVFTTNRSIDEAMEVQVNLVDKTIISMESAELLTGPNAKAENTFENPDVVISCSFEDVSIVNGRATYTLPPLSVAAITLNLE